MKNQRPPGHEGTAKPNVWGSTFALETEMVIYDLLKDFAGTAVALIASCAAILFSGAQAKTAEAQKDIAFDRLNFDVFVRRYEIYQATRAVIDHVKKKDCASADPEWRKLDLKMAERCFFFDKTTRAFLDEVRTVSHRILVTRDQHAMATAGSDEWVRLGATLSADEAKLSQMYARLLPTFERAMALTQLVKGASFV